MSADFKFKGPFQTELAAYISEKRRLGCKYVAEEEIACAFDVLSTDYDCSNGVPKALVDEFTRLKPNWKETTQKKRISFMLNFSRYLINHDINSALPDKAALHSVQESFKPYIFTHEQISHIFEMADQICPSHKKSHIFYPVFLRLLYCTGLRDGEALNLTMQDVDLDAMKISVKDTKNRHDRVLPIDASLVKYLKWYKEQIHGVYHDEDLFFLTNNHKHYHTGNCNVFFVSLIKRMNIPYRGYKNRSASIHSLRHTFCVHSLEKMLHDDIPNGVALKLLSCYMGHQSLSATGRYLQLTAEAFPDLTQKIESMYGDVFPKVEFLPEEVKMPYEE